MVCSAHIEGTVWSAQSADPRSIKTLTLSTACRSFETKLRQVFSHENGDITGFSVVVCEISKVIKPEHYNHNMSDSLSTYGVVSDDCYTSAPPWTSLEAGSCLYDDIMSMPLVCYMSDFIWHSIWLNKASDKCISAASKHFKSVGHRTCPSSELLIQGHFAPKRPSQVYLALRADGVGGERGSRRARVKPTRFFYGRFGTFFHIM